MKAGRLRHQVTIERDANHGILNASGAQKPEDWQMVGNGPRAANVITLSGRERFTAQQVTPELTHRVEMRYDPDVQTKPIYRLVFNERPLQIEAIINVEERNRELHCLCKEAVTA